jgi:hypothetical protein
MKNPMQSGREKKFMAKQINIPPWTLDKLPGEYRY